MKKLLLSVLLVACTADVNHSVNYEYLTGTCHLADEYSITFEDNLVLGGPITMECEDEYCGPRGADYWYFEYIFTAETMIVTYSEYDRPVCVNVYNEVP